MYPTAFTSEINTIQTTQVLSEAKYAGRHKLPTLTGRHKLPTLTAFYTPDKTDTTIKLTVQLLQNQIS